MTTCDRIPLSFKTRCEGNIYRHMVLAIRHENVWGSLGMSRRSDLMYKSLNFKSLLDLIEDFKISYAKNFHSLITCYVGLPFPHDKSSDKPVKWRAIKIKIHKNSSDNIKYIIDEFIANLYLY